MYSYLKGLYLTLYSYKEGRNDKDEINRKNLLRMISENGRMNKLLGELDAAENVTSASRLSNKTGSKKDSVKFDKDWVGVV